MTHKYRIAFETNNLRFIKIFRFPYSPIDVLCAHKLFNCKTRVSAVFVAPSRRGVEREIRTEFYVYCE